jgi:hypothetical protein
MIFYMCGRSTVILKAKEDVHKMGRNETTDIEKRAEGCVRGSSCKCLRKA